MTVNTHGTILDLMKPIVFSRQLELPGMKSLLEFIHTKGEIIVSYQSTLDRLLGQVFLNPLGYYDPRVDFERVLNLEGRFEEPLTREFVLYQAPVVLFGSVDTAVAVFRELRYDSSQDDPHQTLIVGRDDPKVNNLWEKVRTLTSSYFSS